MMVRTSYLRVYQPLEAFAPDERLRWLHQRDRGDAADGHAGETWLVAATLPATDVAAGAEGAFVHRRDGRVLVCPRRTRLRMLAGLLAFRGTVPEEVAEAFVPQTEALRAARELASLNDARPELRSHILQANWHVPLRWFAAFDELERILVEDVEGLRIRYETTLDDARLRLRHVLQVLDATEAHDTLTEVIGGLSGWLEGFEGGGLLELDYGSVARSFSEEELVEDRTAGRVAACVAALDADELDRAAVIFSELVERWGRVRVHEAIN